jgi:hypothetical protein
MTCYILGHIFHTLKSFVWIFSVTLCHFFIFFGHQNLGPGCNQDQLAVSVRELLGFSRCELLLLDAGSGGRGQFGNPEEGERPPLEADSKQRQ